MEYDLLVIAMTMTMVGVVGSWKIISAILYRSIGLPDRFGFSMLKGGGGGGGGGDGDGDGDGDGGGGRGGGRGRGRGRVGGGGGCDCDEERGEGGGEGGGEGEGGEWGKGVEQREFDTKESDIFEEATASREPSSVGIERPP
ncbi:hypothetical protein HZH68_013202 [Vespula germanica]|uniref:Uncharacterized protein n=1 Tax=Vespula germanica TaxID=30212 RepID=A0A834MW63_VESGE|nr:hypothetical protein HZH68_013202 [Vespula germanica]